MTAQRFGPWHEGQKGYDTIPEEERGVGEEAQ